MQIPRGLAALNVDEIRLLLLVSGGHSGDFSPERELLDRAHLKLYAELKLRETASEADVLASEKTLWVVGAYLFYGSIVQAEESRVAKAQYEQAVVRMYRAKRVDIVLADPPPEACPKCEQHVFMDCRLDRYDKTRWLWCCRKCEFEIAVLDVRLP